LTEINSEAGPVEAQGLDFGGFQLHDFPAATKSPVGMKLRAFIGTGVVIAFLTALTIASSPQLHQKLHKVGPNHECAATLIASGNCEHNAPPQGAPKLENAPNSPAFLPQRFQSVIAAAPSSVQEHAPPVAP
jgi:hypothetical protein